MERKIDVTQIGEAIKGIDNLIREVYETTCVFNRARSQEKEDRELAEYKKQKTKARVKRSFKIILYLFFPFVLAPFLFFMPLQLLVPYSGWFWLLFVLGIGAWGGTIELCQEEGKETSTSQIWAIALGIVSLIVVPIANDIYSKLTFKSTDLFGIVWAIYLLGISGMITLSKKIKLFSPKMEGVGLALPLIAMVLAIVINPIRDRFPTYISGQTVLQINDQLELGVFNESIPVRWRVAGKNDSSFRLVSCYAMGSGDTNFYSSPGIDSDYLLPDWEQIDRLTQFSMKKRDAVSLRFMTESMAKYLNAIEEISSITDPDGDPVEWWLKASKGQWLPSKAPYVTFTKNGYITVSEIKVSESKFYRPMLTIKFADLEEVIKANEGIVHPSGLKEIVV